MLSPDIKTIISALPELNLSDLESLDTCLQLTLRIRRQSEVSADLPSVAERPPKKERGLDDAAREILRAAESVDLSLADQALLAAVILSETYHQADFTSRDINDVIEETGRPRVAHITSALSGLLDRCYLTGSTKQLTLSPEGRAKARSLIGLKRRSLEAA